MISAGEHVENRSILEQDENVWKCGNPRRIHQVMMKTTLYHLPMANEPVFYRFKNWINPTSTPFSVSAETLLRTCRTWIWHTLYTKNRQRSGLTQKNWAEPTLDSAVRTQYSSASRVKGSPWSQIHEWWDHLLATFFCHAIWGAVLTGRNGQLQFSMAIELVPGKNTSKELSNHQILLRN